MSAWPAAVVLVLITTSVQHKQRGNHGCCCFCLGNCKHLFVPRAVDAQVKQDTGSAAAANTGAIQTARSTMSLNT